MDSSTTNWCHDVGKLLLRLTIGGLLLLHGLDKIMHPQDFDKILGAVRFHNLPDFLAYGVYVGEAVAPILVIVGLFTRIASAVIAINMAVAVWLAHQNMLWTLNDGGGWAIELQALYFLGALSIMFLGAGSFSFDALWRNRSQATESPPPQK
ncbi:MAG TPA: DoxX family protein [Pirellulales bacterium]|jgi:putative oxidoreductase|nr:DoxX family protein [Pirellulales bacterium]